MVDGGRSCAKGSEKIPRVYVDYRCCYALRRFPAVPSLYAHVDVERVPVPPAPRRHHQTHQNNTNCLIINDTNRHHQIQIIRSNSTNCLPRQKTQQNSTPFFCRKHATTESETETMTPRKSTTNDGTSASRKYVASENRLVAKYEESANEILRKSPVQGRLCYNRKIIARAFRMLMPR